MSSPIRTKHYYGNGERYTYVLQVKCTLCNIDFLIREASFSNMTGRCRKCRSVKHGMRDSQEYNIWYSMIERCTKPNHKFYKNYGGRGIKISKDWEKFENFYRDMGNKPLGKTLERIDNDGNYCKENCKWATFAEQALNKRSNRLLTVGGVTKTVKEWSDTSGLDYDIISKRINKLGWNHKDAVTTKVKKKTKK